MIEVEVKNLYVDKKTLKPMARVTLNLDLDEIQDQKALLGDSFSNVFYEVFNKRYEFYEKLDQLVEYDLFDIVFESKEDFGLIANFMKENNVSNEDWMKEYPQTFLNHVWTNVPGEQPKWLGVRLGFGTEEVKLKYYTLLNKLKGASNDI
jgi:hypothetical protein